MTYLAHALLLFVFSLLTGRILARRQSDRPTDHRSRTPLLLLGLLILWSGCAWSSRYVADTDWPGWMQAEWFAQSGKWITLIAMAAFSTSYVRTRYAERIPPRMRILTTMLLTMIVAVSLFRSYPVYLVLNDGVRDRNGYLLQDRQHEYTCGAVALGNYLERYRNFPPQSERELSKRCKTTSEGTTFSALNRALKSYGITNTVVSTPTHDELLTGPKPAIITISTMPGVRHATLFTGTDDSYAYFIDPATGPTRFPLERFRRIQYGHAITFN